MLKIKDDIDLKELEKYGFGYNEFEQCYERIFNYKDDIYKDDRYHTNNICIFSNKKIEYYEDFDDDYRYVDVTDEFIKEQINDLIKDGIVEKVE